MPRAHIEFPVMSGATKNLSCQAALAQPAFLVGTTVSVCIDVIIEIYQQNAVPIHFQTHHFAAPQVV